jgi:hypothetical protein
MNQTRTLLFALFAVLAILVIIVLVSKREGAASTQNQYVARMNPADSDADRLLPGESLDSFKRHDSTRRQSALRLFRQKWIIGNECLPLRSAVLHDSTAFHSASFISKKISVVPLDKASVIVTNAYSIVYPDGKDSSYMLQAQIDTNGNIIRAFPVPPQFQQDRKF